MRAAPLVPPKEWPEWNPGRWWRVIAPDGSLWCETSDGEEARRNCREGDTLQRIYTRTETEWRDES